MNHGIDIITSFLIAALAGITAGTITLYVIAWRGWWCDHKRTDPYRLLSNRQEPESSSPGC